MRYSFFFRVRLWTRRWFFPPFAGLQTAVYDYRLSKEEDRWIENLDSFAASKGGETEIRSRRIRDLHLVRQLIESVENHRG